MYTYSMETIYLSLREQVAVCTFFMKSPVVKSTNKFYLNKNYKLKVTCISHQTSVTLYSAYRLISIFSFASQKRDKIVDCYLSYPAQQYINKKQDLILHYFKSKILITLLSRPSIPLMMNCQHRLRTRRFQIR